MAMGFSNSLLPALVTHATCKAWGGGGGGGRHNMVETDQFKHGHILVGGFLISCRCQTKGTRQRHSFHNPRCDMQT